MRHAREYVLKAAQNLYAQEHSTLTAQALFEEALRLGGKRPYALQPAVLKVSNEVFSPPGAPQRTRGPHPQGSL
ncbi:hypothetical protein GCM10008955_32830 [Deinococcus malanensis]|uniref:Uncharacterized protein n=1 Tax=Deinococcus malanensis TaxID=1706855 RepID=A0ABQ2F0P8_9DEIO|nr:hypothetical protein GCM10008955_32830 [Deinococcus malanensis]